MNCFDDIREIKVAKKGCVFNIELKNTNWKIDLFNETKQFCLKIKDHEPH